MPVEQSGCAADVMPVYSVNGRKGVRVLQQLTYMDRMSCRLLSGVILISAIIAAAGFQKAPQAGREALRILREEGRKFAAGEITLAEEPDFARRFQREIDRDFIIRSIYRVQDRQHPEVDAYIRWQLLSYVPRLDEFRDWEVERLLRQMPELLQNPAADEAVVSRFRKMTDAVSRMKAEQQAEAILIIRRQWEELIRKREHRAGLNEPARRFAAYWRRHAEEVYSTRGHYEPEITWWELINTLQAGWKVATEKGRFTRCLNERRGDVTFTGRQRERISAEIRRVAEREYSALDNITFTTGEPPRLTVGKRCICKKDALRWLEALNDRGDAAQESSQKQEKPGQSP